MERERGLTGPVDKQSLDRAAADRIRQAITSGAISPGTRLTEASLAEELALSRGTIRVALHSLLAEGLVSLRPYSGWHVLTLNSHDAWELYTLRSCLEALAARLAAQKIDEAGRNKILLAFDNLNFAVEHADDKAVTNADFALHKAIIALAGHQRLAAQYGLVEQQVRLFIASSNATLNSRDLIIANHEELVNAICAGGAEDAERLARGHGIRAAEELIQLLKKQENANSSAISLKSSISLGKGE